MGFRSYFNLIQMYSYPLNLRVLNWTVIEFSLISNLIYFNTYKLRSMRLHANMTFLVKHMHTGSGTHHQGTNAREGSSACAVELVVLQYERVLFPGRTGKSMKAHDMQAGLRETSYYIKQPRWPNQQVVHGSTTSTGHSTAYRPVNIYVNFF